MSDLSDASDPSRVTARSSAFVSRLHHLEGRTIGMASLLTSITASSSQPVIGDCSASRPKSNPVGGEVVDVLIDGNNNEGELEGQGAGAEKDGSIKVRNITYDMN